MKLIKLVVLLVLVAFACSSARADVVVYRLKQTGKFIGSGVELSLKGKGFVLIDPDTRQGYTIFSAIVLGEKIYSVSSFENTRIYTLTGAGKTYTAFSSGSYSNSVAGGRDRNQFSIGRNSTFPITPARSITFPRVIAGTASIVNFADADAMLLDGKATAVFSATDTRTANNAAETLDQTLQRIRDGLIAQGYTEFSL